MTGSSPANRTTGGAPAVDPSALDASDLDRTTGGLSTTNRTPVLAEPVSPVEHGGEVELHGPAPVVRYNPDAPSEEWGWHGSWREFAPRGSRLLLWLGVVGLLLMLFGNHISNVENWWLIAIAALMSAWLIAGEIRIRRERRRRP